MSFLSLAKGDPAARALLQRAIRARYGPRPLMVESLRLSLTTSEKGPLGLSVRVAIEVACVGITHWRWAEVRRLLGLTIGKHIESFDSGAYYRADGRTVKVSHDQRTVQSFRRRLWALQALFLTPLTQDEVILQSAGERVFQAMPEANPDDIATLYLNPDDTVAAVQIERFRPEDRREMPFMIRPENGLQTLNGFVVPAQISYQWGGEPALVYTITNAQLNVKIPLTEFTMQPTAP